MKKYLILIFTLISPLSCYAQPPSLMNKTVMICEFCEFVHERAYFLLRLEKIIQLFKMIDKSPHINTNFNDFHSADFQHPRIKKLIHLLEKDSDLTPFFELWHELYDYKYINDEKLIKEFTRFTILITKKIEPSYSKKNSSSFSDIALNLKDGTYTEAITLRTYIAKRLKKPIANLKKIRCSKENIFESVQYRSCECVFESHTPFQHRAVIRCIEQMADKNSIAPLMALYQEFSQFKFIQDEAFTKEFLLLIFGAHKNILLHNAEHKNNPLKKSTLELITHLYQNLDSLPLEQILDSIDLLSEELPPLLEKYEIKKEMSWQEWKKWLKKYWWAPPGVLFIYGIKVALILRGTPYNPQQQHQAAPAQVPPSQPVYGEYE